MSFFDPLLKRYVDPSYEFFTDRKKKKKVAKGKKIKKTK
jgi:hypothetical protein